jgi:hypothetical protein
MSKQAGFSVRTLLVITAISAVVIATAAVPSPRWVPVLTLGGAAVVAYGIQRAVISPASRPFWLSYFGALLFLATVLSSYHDVMTADSFGFYIAGPLWELFHGEIHESNESYERFVNFAFYLRLTLAVSLPAVIAYAMTFVSRDRNAQSA